MIPKGLVTPLFRTRSLLKTTSFSLHPQSAHRSSTRQCPSSLPLPQHSRLRHPIVSKSSFLAILLLRPASLPPALQAIAVHLADDDSGGGTTTTMSAHQHQQHHGFDLPHPFRKLPSSMNVAAAANVEFNGELSMATTLLGGPGDRSSPNGHHRRHNDSITFTSTSARSSMRTERRMKTPRQRTAHITCSMCLLPAHRLPLLQHFRHTFPFPRPPPTMEEEKGVNQVLYTTLPNDIHSILPSRR